MRLPDKQTYGQASEELRQVMLQSIHRQEEKPVKHKRLSTVLVTVLVLALLTATALAVANRIGLQDLFDTWEEEGTPSYPDPSNLVHNLPQDEALLTAAFEDLEIAVMEARGDGADYYFMTTISLKPGVKGVMTQFWNLYLLSQGYPEMDNPEGLPVYHIYHEILHENGGGNQNVGFLNEDGSLSFMSNLGVFTEADTAQMSAFVKYAITAPGEMPKEEDFQMINIPFTMPTIEAAEAKRAAQAVQMEGTEIEIEEVFFKRTAHNTLCTVYLRYPGGEAVDYLLPGRQEEMIFTLTDAEGNLLTLAENTSLGAAWCGGPYYQLMGRYEMEPIPEKVVLHAVRESDGKEYGDAVIDLVPGGFDAEAVAAYDAQAVHYPPAGLSETVADDTQNVAYTKAPEGGMVSIYLEPDAQSEVLATLYSGVGMDRWGTCGPEWSHVHMASRGSMSVDTVVMGYARTEELSIGEDATDVLKGVVMATVSAPEGVQVHLEPDRQATVAAKLDAGDTVCILGQRDEWYYVQYPGLKENQQLLGYVPVNALEDTGERTTVVQYSEYR